jgi:RNA polymerase sigma-70 factor, ECF subfamily
MMYLVSAIKPNESKGRGTRQPPSELIMDVKTCDQILVQRAQSGEHSAFNALVRKYRNRVMKLSLRYTRNYADAEDAVQNTFIKAHWAIQKFRGEAAFYSWLHRIAVNSAKTVLAVRARNARVFKFDRHDDDDVRETSMLLKELDTPEELALTEVSAAAVALASDGKRCAGPKNNR